MENPYADTRKEHNDKQDRLAATAIFDSVSAAYYGSPQIGRQ
jgi:hypothetical protein